MEDGDELEAFCRREYPRLVGALSLYCGDGDVAQELAQEALERVVARWPRVRQQQAPGAWAHRVAINLANSHYRRRGAERRARSRLGPVAEAVDCDRAEALTARGAVRSLPGRQRAAVVLRFYLDMPVVEVAEALGISPGAVKTLTHRAVTKLRALTLQHEEDVDVC